ncbi:MAG: DNA-processing protein DprA [Candidatus Omnitrophota bacterium]|nr:DNA-processing protein DprA [Candidatus Omnitrophota bacterium]
MEQIEDLILLNMVEGLGFKKLQSLLNAFQGTSGILKAGKFELTAVEGIDNTIAERITRADYKLLSKELHAMKRKGIYALSIFDAGYPENLKKIYSPPLVLYVKGEIKPEDADAAAIVGSRTPSHYGVSISEKLAAGLASKGVTVISGMARGIDSTAHASALKYGRTIAVLGSGLNCVYPPENRKLADEICENGAVVSEFPLDTTPHKFNFPRRNRVISGFSLGVVVVEASARSGSLITADFALEENRELFAVPGRVDSKTSAGTNSLIKQGAKLIENADDVLAEIEAGFKYKKFYFSIGEKCRNI